MTESTAAPRSISWQHLLLLLGVAVVVWTGDFLSKEWILANFEEYESREVLGEALRFTFVRNSGAAFSFASGMTWIFTILAAAVAIGIIVTAARLRSRAWALVLGGLLGGTVGNLFDRLTREPGGLQGHVIDFIHVWAFPAIFNIADIGIVASMGGLIIIMLRGVGLDGSRPVTDEPGGPGPEPEEADSGPAGLADGGARGSREAPDAEAPRGE